jgi:hypothetical protein
VTGPSSGVTKMVVTEVGESDRLIAGDDMSARRD